MGEGLWRAGKEWQLQGGLVEVLRRGKTVGKMVIRRGLRVEEGCWRMEEAGRGCWRRRRKVGEVEKAVEMKGEGCQGCRRAVGGCRGCRKKVRWWVRAEGRLATAGRGLDDEEDGRRWIQRGKRRVNSFP